MAKKKETKKVLRITQVKSGIGNTERHLRTLRALGLRRMHQTVEHEDTPVVRGMLYMVSHLVEVEEQVEE